MAEAENEGLKRLGLGHDFSRTEIIKALRDPNYIPLKDIAPEKPKKVTPRQLVGQPAGPGIGSGPARVLREASDLYSFKSGEVMVCDAVDPNMTFIVPLCSAIVERRGGMLIHGAIIAREYGIPCVTGVPEAVDLIETGDILTVDGYLGVITVNRIDTAKKVNGYLGVYGGISTVSIAWMTPLVHSMFAWTTLASFTMTLPLARLIVRLDP